jgi:4-aminobutyrate aminotransferase-like enzyme
VVATLEAFDSPALLTHVNEVSPVIEDGLLRLKELPFVKHVRGECRGMVWGVELGEFGGLTATDVANCVVKACYDGEGTDGIHLLGPLAKKVVRIAPPLVITMAQADEAMTLMHRCLLNLARDLREC